MPMEVGQEVTPGTILAKVARPDKLKAELRIADVALGLALKVDPGADVRITSTSGVLTFRELSMVLSAASGAARASQGERRAPA